MTNGTWVTSVEIFAVPEFAASRIRITTVDKWHREGLIQKRPIEGPQRLRCRFEYNLESVLKEVRKRRPVTGVVDK